MNTARRAFLKTVVGGMAATAVGPLVDCGSGPASLPPSVQPQVYDITRYGAKGDGVTLDTKAINNAIQQAAAAGGGTVRFPPGNYLSYSIHLQSNITLQLEQGATIIGADPATEGGPGYDPPEAAGPWAQYQEFVHNFYHNSLIWGVGLQNVTILGPGRIWGRGLNVGGPQPSGAGNKSIALKNCSNVVLRGFSVLHGGWDAIKALGTDQLTLDRLVIDTNRGGIDVDCCQHVNIVHCTVNSPHDDGICLKSSYAVGYARVTSDVVISRCSVSGSYVEGTVIDGTRQRFPATDPTARTGRIKLGTESNGGFQNITITDCSFDGCWGLLLASVDGAIMQDIHVSNLTMTELIFCPIFIRLGARMRGPSNVPVGAIRRVTINNIKAGGSLIRRFRIASVISGIPGHQVEDVTLSNITVQHPGGGTPADAALQPAELIDSYPDAFMFGTTPSHAFFIRHAGTVNLSGAQFTTTKEDDRPAFYLSDVQNAQFTKIRVPQVSGVPAFALQTVGSFVLAASPPLPDTEWTNVQNSTL